MFVLEWDPVYRHIRTWVFTPHVEVPENLVQAIRTAKEPVLENRVMPDPEEWPLPYGYFPIGKTRTMCSVEGILSFLCSSCHLSHKCICHPLQATALPAHRRTFEICA